MRSPASSSAIPGPARGACNCHNALLPAVKLVLISIEPLQHASCTSAGSGHDSSEGFAGAATLECVFQMIGCLSCNATANFVGHPAAFSFPYTVHPNVCLPCVYHTVCAKRCLQQASGPCRCCVKSQSAVHAARNHQRLRAYISRIVRRQICNGRSHVARRAEPPRKRLLLDRGPRLVRLRQGRRKLRWHIPCNRPRILSISCCYISAFAGNARVLLACMQCGKQHVCGTSGCTWGNAVDADAVVAQLLRQGLGQAQQRCLADGIPATIDGGFTKAVCIRNLYRRP
jgi:hypothetical protein